MPRSILVTVGLLSCLAAPLAAQLAPRAAHSPRQPVTLCAAVRALPTDRNPAERELRCVYRAVGPGRFGLLSYVDVPVYQPATPMPGTHVVGVAGQPAPAAGESFEAWEWRLLRSAFGPEAHRVHRALELLHPEMAERVLRFEALLAAAGVAASRRETWRAPERQAHLFQQGRSRPGPLATATLTSWHCQTDARGRPAARAADYHVAAADLPRFHELAREAGLHSFGADSNDPGHVFLPPREPVPARDVILLRTLPRVPEVTLATGRPVDERVDGSARALYRAQLAQFLAAQPRSSLDGRLARFGAQPAVALRSLLHRAAAAELRPGAASTAGAAADGAPRVR